jgi:hypothetical protein
MAAAVEKVAAAANSRQQCRCLAADAENKGRSEGGKAYAQALLNAAVTDVSTGWFSCLAAGAAAGAAVAVLQ